MYEWALSNTLLIVFGLICVALIVVAIALSRMGRRKIVRLRNEVKELSGRVSALETIEQRRFLIDLKSKGGAPTVGPTAEIVPLSESGTSQRPPAA
jgi:hypothetical protein